MENPKVQEILEKQVLTVVKAVEDKIDDELAALDRIDSDDLEVLRERRLQQMKKVAEKKSRWVALGHGEYSEIPNEKEFFSVVKASERVVCHFYRENWPCKSHRIFIIVVKGERRKKAGCLLSPKAGDLSQAHTWVVDKHLAILAKQHIETRFVKINAENSQYLSEKLRIVVLPTLALVKNAKVEDYVFVSTQMNAENSQYLSEKLRIVVLPTLALVKNAKVEDYVVGFDELGGTDNFSTEELEERLAKAKVIVYEGESSFNTSKSGAPSRSVRQGSTSYSSDSD
ncbi:hypothetical protein OROGR_031481 [Orobanche gracilis]